MKKQTKYMGACYIGVVGSEHENGECRDTIEAIERQKKDTPPQYIRATKGYEARQMHLNNWYMGTKLPFMLLLDSDMKFPRFTLARLRAHRLPYVSGLYMRRRYNPIAPVWFEQGEPGRMPMIPFTAAIMENTLYRLGASGWGCILMHRDVVTATRKILKGEPEILEDDMDVWPYDLKKIMRAMQTLEKFGNGSVQYLDMQKALFVLKQEFRPLRGLKDSVGSDIRFPFFARLAGYELIGDSGVLCEHMLNYPLTPMDYNQQPAAAVRDITIAIRNDTLAERQRILEAVRV